MMSDCMQQVPALYPEDRLQFDNETPMWRVRAVTKNGRYVVATWSHLGKVTYTIIDRTEKIRGALNTVSHDLHIDTFDGSDKNIDRTILMLEGATSFPFKVSTRDQAPLNITRLIHAGEEYGDEDA